MLRGKNLLLIISGGIAAYKCLDLIRRLKDQGAATRVCLTAAAREFVTPLSVAALSEDKVYTELFSLTDESEMGHIRLSREADLVVVAPATADLLARMAVGMANDLATTVLLATDKPVLAAPAMNVRMWLHDATQTNLRTLKSRGVLFVGPNEGDMACGEWGPGRMAESEEIVSAIAAFFKNRERLRGRRALVTSGPTREPIDPVRFLSNRSSGRQGHAIASALSQMGAETTLVSGPVQIPDPTGVTVVHVETAAEMLDASRAALPVDVVVCAAAVSDWRAREPADQKIKKRANDAAPEILLMENPDILAILSRLETGRPRLVVGFAAETNDILGNAEEKRRRKGCDWILCNDVSPGSGVFGGEANTVLLISEAGIEAWPKMLKEEVAQHLAERIAARLAEAT
jgi:phosphopantothenoylcysteine decarboxylase/phosphopantothenate--cysteine ligase